MPDDKYAPLQRAFAGRRRDPAIATAFDDLRDAVDGLEAPSPEEIEGRGGWMLTYTGRRFWPLTPRAEDIRLADIAHALAMTCRYGGHCARFYSVAEHSVLLARHFHDLGDAGRHARLALLHDAAEAYVGDLVRPLKHDPALKVFIAAEDRVADMIFAKWGLAGAVDSRPWARVMAADSRIIHDEMAALFRDTAFAPGPKLGIEIGGWPPDVAEARFLEEARTLGLDVDA